MHSKGETTTALDGTETPSKPFPWVSVVAALLVAIVPLSLVYLWMSQQTPLAVSAPLPLTSIVRLIERKNFEEAKQQLSVYLAAFPADRSANLMMAQLLMDQSVPEPLAALKYLDQIHESDPKKRALVAFFQGRAHYQAGRYDLAETSWTEALRLHPTVPEAGTSLLNLYELEGRYHDARQLVLKLQEIEPDPRDRVRFLLSLARLDIEKPSPESQSQLFGKLNTIDPANLKIANTLGNALIRDSRPEQGLQVIRTAFERQKEPSAEAWDIWLKALDDAGRPEAFAKELQQLPESLKADPRFAKHRAQAAQLDQDWKAAADWNRQAHEFDPQDSAVLYRLSRSLKLAGEEAESKRITEILAQYQSALAQLQPLCEQAMANKMLGLTADIPLYQKIADLREKMGRPKEAKAWHALVLRESPNDPISQPAILRLQ